MLVGRSWAFQFLKSLFDFFWSKSGGITICASSCKSNKPRGWGRDFDPKKTSSAVWTFFSNEDFQHFSNRALTAVMKSCKQSWQSLDRARDTKHRQNPRPGTSRDVMNSFQHFESLNFRVFQKVPLDLWIRLLCGWSCDNRCHVVEIAGPSATAIVTSSIGGAMEDATLKDTLFRIFALAWPSILSELSTPMLGLVDTIVVGHFPSSVDLGALALAIAAYNPLIVVFNFLRMGFGGVIAQAMGAQDEAELVACAARGVLLGLAVGLLLCIMREPLAMLLFGYILHEPSPETLQQAQNYFQVRILGAPAALSNFVVQAWLINVQRTDLALAANLILNVANALLCVSFGCILDFGIVGVATATVLSNYLAFAFGILQIRHVSQQLPWMPFPRPWTIDWSLVFQSKRLLKLASLNGNVVLRSICMMMIVTDFTSLSVKLGQNALAGNNLLMQLQMLISFAADGFANAGEALVGEAIGQGDRERVRLIFKGLMVWGFLLGLCFTMIFVFGGRWILLALTSHADVVSYASAYLPWQWAAPFLSFTAYLMDGIFVGAARPSNMRDATCMALVVFWTVGHVSASNDVLWGAYMLHLMTRAAVLLYWYPAVEDAADELKEYRETLLPDRIWIADPLPPSQCDLVLNHFGAPWRIPMNETWSDMIMIPQILITSLKSLPFELIGFRWMAGAICRWRGDEWLGDSSRQWPQELGSHDAGPRKDMLHRVNLSECENRENAVLTQTLNKPTLVNSSFSWFAQSHEGKKRWNGVLLGVFSKSRKKKIWHGPGVGCLGCLGVVRCHRSRFDLLKRHAIVLGGHGRTRWRRWNAARTTPSSWGQDWLPNTAVTAVLLLLCFYILSMILSLLFLQMFAVMFF